MTAPGLAGCRVHGRFVEGCSWCNEARIKEEFAAFIAGLRGWELVSTLTFDPKRAVASRPLGPQKKGHRTAFEDQAPRRIAFDVARSRVIQWLKKSEKLLDRRIGAVVAMEAHRNGWPHFHALLDVGGLQYGDISAIGELWFDRNGYAKIELPRDVGGVARYAAKYLSKDAGDVVFWPRPHPRSGYVGGI